MSDTCAGCKFFQQFYGEQKGRCFAHPPEIYQSGVSDTGAPETKCTRVACWFFVALPAGAPTQIKTKVDPESHGDCVKLAQEAKHALTPPPVAPALTPKKRR